MTIMKTITVLTIILFLAGCTVETKQTPDEHRKINETIDQWHAAAAAADFSTYFSFFNENAVFIGTDPTENWNKADFMVWSKPYFDRGRAWSFTALERNIYFDETGKTAWFDELLNTQMKICRGSGVVVNIAGEWKIQHYVLSMTIPNDLTDIVVSAKKEIEDQIIADLQKK